MATITAGGRIIVTKNLTVTSGTDTQIGFNQPVNTVILKCRTAGDLQVRSSQGATEYFTLPSGQSLTLDLAAVGIENGVVQPTNIWLRSSSGTVVAEIIGLYGG